ncbi:energy-coupling factor ABC transporter permease [Luteipulveratus flavus]|uniref:Energy-coupling factor ABC transporter permease n=1 Tax=Luteipulveratus flavus TaxID=3031728 RepID=A0ABT6C2V2_9MICO|nr:energy-coupling factor ABC transporter permease [Luteipulveratus sp. YIM 133296]MDF8262873.1 energy-coupling factor ABC transporter permease [Luteipulveratus sp. YIM 133296]
MHVPDGFIDLPVSAATGAVAAGAVAIALRKAAPEIRETGPALPGLVSAFIFAVQMVNFPVGAGTSGHLLGGVLAAALVGPWTGLLCMTVVLLVQGVFFADGGLTALGTNITDMGVVTVIVGYAVMRLALGVLPRRSSSISVAAFVAAMLAVPAAAVAFTGIYAVGGSVDIPLGKVATAMIGWHVLIGIGEALITTAVLSAVLAARPDLVFVARHLRRDLELVDADGKRTTVAADALEPATGRSAVHLGRRSVIIALSAAAVVAFGLSYFASAHPDGLEYVGQQLGFEHQDSAVAGGPMSGYAVSGVQNTFLSGGLAGLIGVALTVLIGCAIAWIVRRVRPVEKAAPERESSAVGG